jgi:hypothetical protein
VTVSITTDAGTLPACALPESSPPLGLTAVAARAQRREREKAVGHTCGVVHKFRTSPPPATTRVPRSRRRTVSQTVPSRASGLSPILTDKDRYVEEHRLATG